MTAVHIGGPTNKTLKKSEILTATAIGVAFLIALAARPLGVLAAGNDTCAVPSAAYPNIQSAVNNTSCNTVKVASGTYNESVTINRSLTLKGAKSGDDARNRNARNESIINKVNDNTANITITANDVTVDGFTLNGPSSTGTAAFVMQTGNSGETIANNIVNNPGRTASITTSNTTFKQNLVHNTSTSGSGFQGNSTPVTGNVMKDNSFDGTTPNQYDSDINFIEGSTNETITGNNSTDNATLVSLFKTSNSVVKNNTYTGQRGNSAIYIGGGDNNITVSDNKITAASTGVNVANDFGVGTNNNITIKNNVLQNNNSGIKVGSSAVTSENTVVAHQNQLTGNTTAGFNNLSTYNQNGTCNYWGAKNGPGPVGPGSGDKVTQYVAFAPWTKTANGDCALGSANGDLRLANPSQRIVFNVNEREDITKQQGTVRYTNFDYPGGLSYQASVVCSYVNSNTNEARFMFQIPSGHPGLSGLYVVSYVKHVKNGPDQYGHAATSDRSTATQWCENGVGYSPTMYTVTNGNVDIEEN